MKRPVLVLIGATLALAPHGASAFTVQSYNGGGSQANIVDPDAVREKQATNGTVTGGDHSGFSFGISGNNAWGNNGASGGDRFPSFPGTNNHLSTTDNSRALQYGISPLSPLR